MKPCERSAADLADSSFLGLPRPIKALHDDPLYLAASASWMPRGACRKEDPELFFPTGSTKTGVLEQVTAAKRVCGRCHVRATCLSYAQQTRQPHGIWGGTTGSERRQLHGTRERAPAGGSAATDGL